jgi:CheY-like chemotaxis protein
MSNAPKRILYVEDENDIRTVATMSLEMLGGFEVVACASGAEALAEAPTAAADLILLDVMMPGMDGPATLAALRAIPAARDTPVVFMTAKVQASEVQGYRGLGALGVIPKPFDPMTLHHRLVDLWEQRARA